VVREAIFTGAYLGVIPLMRENLMKKWPDTFAERPVTSNVVASVGAGLGAAIVTHPFDTVRDEDAGQPGDPTHRYSTVLATGQLGGAALTGTVQYSGRPGAHLLVQLELILI